MCCAHGKQQLTHLCHAGGMIRSLPLPLLWLIAVPASAAMPQAQSLWDKGDYRHAFAEAFEPALAGDPHAQFMLGEAYRLGRSVATDPFIAQDWYLRAAKQGDVSAAAALGRLYLQLHQTRDAIPWLTLAASHDDPRAMATLATLYYNGEGVDRDLPLAYSLMHKAADKGLTEARERLSMMDDVAQPVDVSNPPTALAASQPVLPPAPIPVAVPPTQVALSRPVPPMAPPPAPVSIPQPVAIAVAQPVGKFIRVADPVSASPKRISGVRVQIGAYKSLRNARRVLAAVASRTGGLAKISPVIIRRGRLYRVQAVVENVATARLFAARLRAVRLDCFVAGRRLRRA
jgi:hypothetical protein